ncbi:MAG: restriction endonuclease [Kineosporiaceae bacterium]|nr:restriction endonuclease [Aeromicrobium sp.]
MRPLVSIEEAESRLLQIFPRSAFDPVLSNPLGAAAIRSFIYVDAVVDSDPVPRADLYWGRPSTVMWMSDDVVSRGSVDDRLAWRAAAAKKREAVVQLLEGWGVPTKAGYADNTRETLRDETFRKWKESGAIRERAGVPKTSSKGRWALEAHFAALFDPALSGDALVDAIKEWRDKHLSPTAKIKVQFALQKENASHAVTVALPNTNQTRTLESGIASLILKGVIEQWATARLEKPYVVTISEPGDKIFTGDASLLQFLGVSINASALLPDAVVADLGPEPAHFWMIEAVNTDGEIDEMRKTALLQWAAQQNIPAEQCFFLTAFESRNIGAARKRLKDLAAGTYAYFADEPGYELAWYPIT